MEENSASILSGELSSLTNDPVATDDLTEATNKAISDADILFKANRTADAIEELLVIEKKSRQAADAVSVSKLVCKVLMFCKDSNDWTGINEYLTILSKKRSQLKRVVVDMVQLCMTFFELTPDMPTKLTLITTLSSVTEGKIFVEVERARILMILSKIKEADGDINGAATVLEDVQVETFGAMDRKEKAEFILEQMRVVLLKNDFIRCQILSKKINSKFLENDDVQELKLRYYKYMIEYHHGDSSYIDIAKALFAIFHTPQVQQDPATWRQALESYALYLLLAEHSNEQSDLLHKLISIEEKKLKELPIIRQLLKEMTTAVLISWPLTNESVVSACETFKSDSDSDKRWTTLRLRVLQHNVRTLAGCYHQIRLGRLAELLAVDLEEAESIAADMVITGLLEAKIDRPSQLVWFGGRLDVDARLNDWSKDLSQVLDLIEDSCQHIEKQRMIHAARQKKLQSVKMTAR
eukprot:Lankesteria_metandrocarpae@DN2859_c0_g1_i2.p1